ncbi:hypothetical protein T10_2220 [Trichinella papuae]|uniref:Uncharacterized protein n=1 Tax=Trichinella papuae TaxID=268474 RepID=A0A0V1M6I2_9BILA|nr:hypothetical protein T10_2220 [Trichinella papuae]
MFDVMRDVQLATSYGDRDRILHKVKKKYANVTLNTTKEWHDLVHVNGSKPRHSKTQGTGHVAMLLKRQP